MPDSITPLGEVVRRPSSESGVAIRGLLALRSVGVEALQVVEAWTGHREPRSRNRCCETFPWPGSSQLLPRGGQRADQGHIVKNVT